MSAQDDSTQSALSFHSWVAIPRVAFAHHYPCPEHANVRLIACRFRLRYLAVAFVSFGNIAAAADTTRVVSAAKFASKYYPA